MLLQLQVLFYNFMQPVNWELLSGVLSQLMAGLGGILTMTQAPTAGRPRKVT